jgi:hypothetical protein
VIFLQQALEAGIRRGFKQVIERLALGVIAFSYGKRLNWGAGGPIQWTTNRPYLTPPGSEDQVGFHSYAWYGAQTKEVLGRPLPMLLLGAGSRLSDFKTGEDHPIRHAEENKLLAQWLLNDPKTIERLGVGAAPEEILAGCFWILAAEADHPAHKDAWFPTHGRPLPVVEAFALQQHSQGLVEKGAKGNSLNSTATTFASHYVLIPEFSSPEKNWIFDAALPFGYHKHAQIGTSLDQAMEANRVTILGVEKWLDEAAFERLRSRGCMIEEVYGCGTLLATKLAHL